ncbi:MAG: metallophosphoesterase [Oscillospiraceae bacterium]|nr:metallophosphoesterase [Oscillospiraceae bacterium]
MIYVTGDMHGCLERLYDKEFRKLKKGDILIVCGDFGYIFDGSKTETEVINFFAERKFITAFVDGTHDNLPKINRSRVTVWKGGRVHRIKGNLLHLMRGQIFNIDGTTIFTFGGGESIDKDMRVEQNLWWREEEPTPDEMASGAEALDEAGLKVDYIITHEPPSLVKSAMLLRRGDSDRVNKLNGYFEEIGKSCSFKHWYFGSLHEDRVITDRHTCLFRKIVPINANEKLPKKRKTQENTEKEALFV